MVKELEYTQPDGTKAKAAYLTHGSAYQLGAKRESFAQLVAGGALPFEAYCQVYGMVSAPDTVELIKEKVRHLSNDTTVVLRIQELKRPVLRKLHRKIEYGIQQALEQCDVAYDLAYAQADVKGMLAAVRMQAELAKLLAQEINVSHKYGILDDASTATLLALRKEIEVRQAKGNNKLKTTVEEIKTVSEGGGGAAVGVPIGSHPEAVPN